MRQATEPFQEDNLLVSGANGKLVCMDLAGLYESAKFSTSSFSCETKARKSMNFLQPLIESFEVQ